MTDRVIIRRSPTQQIVIGKRSDTRIIIRNRGPIGNTPDVPIRIPIFVEEKPNLSQIVLSLIAPANITWTIANWRALAGTPATVQNTLTFYKTPVAGIPTPWGTLVYNVGQYTGVYTVPAPTLLRDELLTLIASNPQDLTLANLTLLLSGEYS